ncbi:MAG: preprotein translocase subunit SecY [Candidatus Cloacimonetes bacterium]|jgi:preprotein translocase subunit SecY|nr:preprotein translocase subunit SecY [Candidatus Cloacimonadota bacterium]MCB5278712.1 preprotein translocase subunit SecY [Candidatus Cloacimonadota bacterium]MCK9331880.1 preprotein translocase subunit SecY [Candidatus Cloacimonadota bacterium]MDD2209752.1 preprotein translocase subunit SecY [Candidatus Cloacimonadota bacterium]MDD3282109.1 preprotein translocase subunit SecY [Candidatus Cloacimonadota bacterium]
MFRIPDLKKKILFTALFLVLYRMGSFVPIPGVDATALQAFFEGAREGGNTLFGLLDLFVGGNFERASVFALGIMPYITASIVIQLLGSIIPYFEKLRKEGAEGQKKLNQITRYGTVGLGAFNAVTITLWLSNLSGGVVPVSGILFHFTGIITLVTGTMIVMWIGEQITEHGIGNGISLIIFAGIIARYPEGFIRMFQKIGAEPTYAWKAVFAVLLMVAVTTAVIFVTEATRKIPVQYAKRIVGRRVYGGQSTYIPLRVNTAGVIPIIFAQSVLMFPATIAAFFGSGGGFWVTLQRWLSPGAALYTILYVSLIIFFAYFYTAIVLNPTEMAENMVKYGGHIPGKKPGKKTAEYINSVLTRITLPGAVFFAFVALLPEIMSHRFDLPFYFGGTGLIIVVGVALDTLQQIESHLVMRHYDGFMKKGKLRGRSS